MNRSGSDVRILQMYCHWSAIGPSDNGDAYASAANRERLKGRHSDGIMRMDVRGRPLRASEKRLNRLISKRRFPIEQCFGTMKRLFGLHRARYS